MNSRERTERYAEIRVQQEDFIGTAVLETAREFSSGRLAASLFGLGSDALDALFLSKELDRKMPVAVEEAVEQALEDGYGWPAIAAALGMSSQGARKQYGRLELKPGRALGVVGVVSGKQNGAHP